MFDMMTKEMRKPAIKTIDEIFTNDFTLWIKNHSDHLNVFKEILEKLPE